MSVFAGCMDVRNMLMVTEIECPHCGEKDGMEIFTKDGLSVGESSCRQCGYGIPEGIHLDTYLKNMGVLL